MPATYGDPNVVGYKEPIATKRQVAAGASGAVGARLLYTGARPNVAGRIASADSKVSGLEDKLANEAKYKTPRKAVTESLQRQHERAVGQAKIVRAKAPLRAGAKVRGIRAGAGVGLLGLAAAAYPWRKKQQPAIPTGVPGA